jgi:hypothetical protein
MSVIRRDAAAALLTALAVLTFFATHEGWGVPLVGDSRRWAAVVVLLLGVGACGRGEPQRDARSAKVPMALGVIALALGVLAIATGSLTALSLLVLDTVLLWVVATARHLGVLRRAHNA